MTGARPGLAERLNAAVGRTPRNTLRQDAYFTAVLAAFGAALALTIDDARAPDALGWTLLMCGHVPLVWRRRRPMPVLFAVLAFIGPYHALDYNHTAAIQLTMVVLYTIAVTGTARRTLLTGCFVIGGTVLLNAIVPPHQVGEVLRISGWVVAVLLFGGYVRVHRQYVASVVERAERAERTREEEARRRVAEERLRIARDLHDLLAHTITLIGVQTSVAAHVLAADPDRLDREAVAKALDDISGTCRSARGELRTTLEVLRESQYGGDQRGPLPGLDGVPDLAETARLSGAEVEVSVHADDVPPAVGAAAYRIVQEALTNAVRHGGPDVPVRVDLRAEGGTLRVAVTDEGAGDPGGTTPGFGLVGMRERARSVGGTVEAGVRGEGGFEVVAVLPLRGGLPAQAYGDEDDVGRGADVVGEAYVVREAHAVREAYAVRGAEPVRDGGPVPESSPEPVWESGAVREAGAVRAAEAGPGETR
ncbi:sensor histidine kinase [Streptomyces sp. NPDC060065]|uniref:sensor histidine kinase n=1 Tax=Streptomyces sp. NPDC060065 TaxID=3347050 RepID=UPI00369B1378